MSRLQWFYSCKSAAKNWTNKLSSLSTDKKNEYAGACLGIMIGLYINNVRIKHANYYLVNSRGKAFETEMPKYPLHLRAISSAFFSWIGYIVGSLTGFTVLVPASVIGHLVGTYAESSVEYDRECEKIYYEKNDKRNV